MAELFLDEASQLQDSIAEGLAREDLRAVANMSHRIKGSSGLLGASGTFVAARDLNDLAKAGDLVGATKAWPRLQAELALLEPELHLLIADAAAMSH